MEFSQRPEARQGSTHRDLKKCHKSLVIKIFLKEWPVMVVLKAIDQLQMFDLRWTQSKEGEPE